jgi:CDP-glucose 4,6-dehydratase
MFGQTLYSPSCSSGDCPFHAEPVHLETLETNVMGLANMLSAVDKVDYSPQRPCVVVVVTLDKCYENREVYTTYREEEALGGSDIYSAGKGTAEIVAASWSRSFFTPRNDCRPSVLLATCRAGNVIGIGDWSKDRIMVDVIQAMNKGEPIPVQNPLPVRPWQHVLEPLSGYINIGAVLGTHPERWREFCSAWNFGPGSESEHMVAALSDAIVRHWGGSSWKTTPDANAVHEAHFLKFAIEKARHCLGWKPVWGFERTVEETMRWYRAVYTSGCNPMITSQPTQEQIEAYMVDAGALSIP